MHCDKASGQGVGVLAFEDEHFSVQAAGGRKGPGGHVFDPDHGELLAGVVVTDEANALEGLTHPLARHRFLDEVILENPLALDVGLPLLPRSVGGHAILAGHLPAADQGLELRVHRAGRHAGHHLGRRRRGLLGLLGHEGDGRAQRRDRGDAQKRCLLHRALSFSNVEKQGPPRPVEWLESRITPRRPVFPSLRLHPWPRRPRLPHRLARRTPRHRESRDALVPRRPRRRHPACRTVRP